MRQTSDLRNIQASEFCSIEACPPALPDPGFIAFANRFHLCPFVSLLRI
jgi:hypothetical protein